MKTTKVKILLVLLVGLLVLTGCSKNEEPQKEVDAKPFCATAFEDHTTIEFSKSIFGDGHIKANLEYSLDGEKWEKYNIDDEIELMTGESVYFRGDNPDGFGGNVNFYSSHSTTKLSGNIMGLLDPTYQREDVPAKGFKELFYCANINDISELCLPATTLSEYCYEGMFESCRFLKTIPEGFLPATKMAPYCYYNMFSMIDCLEMVPENLLPSTELAERCYGYMFYYCPKLQNVPKLPATELYPNCYAAMFSQCFGLTAIPEDLLPATKLAQSCYTLMFAHCTSLTKPCNLPAPTLMYGCYQGMFNDTGIKVSEVQDDEYAIPFVIEATDEGAEKIDENLISSTGGQCTLDMFANTKGIFIGSPELGKTYYIAK